MESVRTAILDLVRAMVEDMDGVSVTARQHDSMAFKVRVSRCDFERVLSKIDIIKTLAASFSGLAAGEQLRIYMDDGEQGGAGP